MPIYGSIDIQIILSEYYETLLRLHNHYNNDNSRPIASVAYHPEEEFTTNSQLANSIRLFASTNIKDTFGINFLEYLSLPRDYIELMIDSAQKELKKKDKALDEIKSDLEGLQQQ